MTSGIIFFFLALLPLAFIIAFSGLELVLISKMLWNYISLLLNKHI